MSIILAMKKLAEAGAVLYKSRDNEAAETLHKINLVYDELEKRIALLSFTCNVCKKVKDYSEIVHGKIYHNMRGVCKICDGERAKIYAMSKAAKKKPESYMQCNSCDRTFSKFSGRKKEFGNRPEIKFCKFCGSEEVEAYV